MLKVLQERLANTRWSDVKHACIPCSLLILLFSVQSAFADSSLIPERRKPQFDCAGSGQDADFRSGVFWPAPRFKVLGDAFSIG
jgi:hypothetical protein